MANFVFTDARVEINAVVLSTAIKKVTLKVDADAPQNTTFGATYHSRLGGLKDWSVQIDFNQDFAASQVDATLWPLLGTSTTIKIRPTSSAISATNPEYSGSAILSSYPPLDGSVGDVASVSANFEGAGTLARAVA